MCEGPLGIEPEDECQPEICLRCGKEFSNPIPPVTNPEGYTEIATDLWCADCNALVMTVLSRGRTAYQMMNIQGSQVIGRNHAD